MRSKAHTPEEYLKSLPKDRVQPMNELRNAIRKNLPEGFAEVMGYGMIGYVVPHELYPDGYHCDPRLPLPFMNIASQKNYIALYHMGLYRDEKLLAWLKKEYQKQTKKKLDTGKSCLRFKPSENIPYELIGQLSRKISPAKWISLYEKMLKK